MKEGPTIFMKIKERETCFGEGPTILIKTKTVSAR